MDPDRLGELEEERRFLLRSIDDLDREHEVGDVDDDDHRVLRDGYVARAASVLRAIDEGRAALPARAPRRWSRIVTGIAVTAVLAAGAGWWVAHSSGQRLAGQTITGGAPIDQVSAKLSQARQLLGTDPASAIKLYQDVRTLDPTNAEARTYIAWLLVITSRSAEGDVADLALTQALESLQAVTTSTADYPDAWCFLAVIHGRFQDPPDPTAAQSEAQACLARNPPTDMRGFIQEYIDSQDTGSTPASTDEAPTVPTPTVPTPTVAASSSP
jgi:hypothetical protein